MRLLVSTLFVLITAHMAFAQVEKGRFLIGVNTTLDLNFGNIEVDVPGGTEIDVRNLQLEASGAYFVIDQLALGVVLGAGSTATETGPAENAVRNIAIGPFARYYFNDSDWKPFAQTSIQFGTGSTETNNFEQDFRTLAFLLGGGVTYFITDNVGIEGIANFTRLNTNYENIVSDQINTNFGIKVGFVISL